MPRSGCLLLAADGNIDHAVLQHEREVIAEKDAYDVEDGGATCHMEKTLVVCQRRARGPRVLGDQEFVRAANLLDLALINGIERLPLGRQIGRRDDLRYDGQSGDADLFG